MKKKEPRRYYTPIQARPEQRARLKVWAARRGVSMIDALDRALALLEADDSPAVKSK